MFKSYGERERRGRLYIISRVHPITYATIGGVFAAGTLCILSVASSSVSKWFSGNLYVIGTISLMFSYASYREARSVRNQDGFVDLSKHGRRARGGNAAKPE